MELKASQLKTDALPLCCARVPAVLPHGLEILLNRSQGKGLEGSGQQTHLTDPAPTWQHLNTLMGQSSGSAVRIPQCSPQAAYLATGAQEEAASHLHALNKHSILGATHVRLTLSPTKDEE